MKYPFEHEFLSKYSKIKNSNNERASAQHIGFYVFMLVVGMLIFRHITKLIDKA